MENEELTKLVLQIEDQASIIKYDFEIAEAFSKLIEENKDRLTPDQIQQLKWEFLLFRLTTHNHFANDGLKIERFGPMMEFKNGNIFPDPNNFPDESYLYFEHRSKVSKNPILKARYLDFLWEKSKLKQKHLFAQEAVNQYLLVVDAYENEDAFMERLDGLQRATELVLILEGKQSSKPLTEKVVAKLSEQISNTAQTGKYRWLIEMFELVLALQDFYPQEQIKEFVDLSDKASAIYHAEQNFHIQRHFLKLKANLEKLLNTPPDKQSVNDAIGQSYLDEAKAKSGSGLVKAHFLQEAIDYYSKLGNTEKVKELTARVKAATTQAIENNEFKQFSATIEMKKEDLDKIKASLGVGEEVPERMGTIPTFFPNWDHAVQMTARHKKEFVFMHMVKKVSYGPKYPISNPQTPEQEEEDHVMDNFRIEVELALKWLTGFLGELIKEDKVSIGDFKKFFLLLKSVDADTYETVLEGLDSYFKGDHFHAAYVLTLQLEDFLRQLLAVFGGETTIPEAGAFREKTLGSVLRELKPYISEPVYRYISWVTEDYRGFNLRNDIAHGFFKKKRANPIYSTAILHIFCLLIAHTSLRKKK